MNFFVVGITGIIGSGKSTLINFLKEKNRLYEEIRKRYPQDDVEVEFILEPVEDWINKGWLQKFYENPKKRGFAFQMGVFDSYVDSIKKVMEKYNNLNKTVVIVVERTMYCQMLFWQSQEFFQAIDIMEDEIYNQMWLKWKDMIPDVDLVVNLNVDIKESLNRITIRNRNSEKKGVEEGYLECLDFLHHEFYKNGLAQPPNSPKVGITCLNIDNNPENTSLNLEKISSQIASSLVPIMLIK